MSLYNNIDETVASQPLSVLDLPTQVQDEIASAGIRTIGEIYDLEAEELILAVDIQRDLAEQILQKVLDFISDPSKWYKQRSLELAPSIGDSQVSFPIFLPNLLREIFKEANREREYSILERRFNLNNRGSYTLQELGDYYEISRQRVRQIEVTAIHLVSKVLSGGIIATGSREVSQELVQEVRDLRYELETGVPVITESAIVLRINERYGVELSANQLAHFSVIFESWGWRSFGESIGGHGFKGVNPRKFWVIRSDEVDVKQIATCCKKILRILHLQASQVPYIDLKIEVNRNTKKRYSDQIIRTAIAICMEVESTEDDRFQIIFSALKSAAQQAYRILSESGTPLGVREIAKEISQRLTRVGGSAINHLSLVNQMVDDVRFIPYGERSGVWALSEWDDVVRGSIVEIMKEFFHIHGKPAKAKDVYDYVSERRPVSPKSIPAYLSSENDFVRVGHGIYQLREWVAESKVTYQSATVKRWTWEEFAEEVIRIFDQEKLDRMPIAKLAQLLQTSMERSTTPYSQLQRCPAIQIVPSSKDSNSKDAILVRDFQNSSIAQGRMTLRDRVQQAIRELLRNQPDQSVPMKQLKQQVMKKTGVKGQTFYAYLAEMIDVQKAPIPDTRTFMCIWVGGESDEAIETIPDKWDAKFTYDIAISYAGKERGIAKTFHRELHESGLRVFFDRAQLGDLVGRNLRDDLTEIYGQKARLCVLLASEAYNNSQVAQIERQAAQAREMKDDGYIIYVKLEPDVVIKGVVDTEAYLDYRNFSMDELVDIILQALQNH